MKHKLYAGALISTLFIAACGGGGGDNPLPVTPGAQPVAISEANAKPVSAHALDTSQNLSATEGGGLITGVQVQTAVDTIPAGPLLVTQAVQSIIGKLTASPALATGVTVNQTSNCALGGTITVSGNVASSSGLGAGDSIAVSAAACKESTNGVITTMSGSLAISVVSGSITGALPYHVVLATTVSNLSVQTGDTTVTAAGDARIDINVASATQETVTATGSVITSSTLKGSTSRTLTLRNYAQSVALSGTLRTNSLTASVESDSTLLGPAGGSYSISTPTPVTWDASTNALSSGVVKVVGAANSQLLVTVGTAGAVTIQLDANGDGTYEKSIASTVTELRSLL